MQTVRNILTPEQLEKFDTWEFKHSGQVIERGTKRMCNGSDRRNLDFVVSDKPNNGDSLIYTMTINVQGKITTVTNNHTGHTLYL